jgi:hypothetical protein
MHPRHAQIIKAKKFVCARRKRMQESDRKFLSLDARNNPQKAKISRIAKA